MYEVLIGDRWSEKRFLKGEIFSFNRPCFCHIFTDYLNFS